jgi:secondary thiamine-phosphate synthase enzyme
MATRMAAATATKGPVRIEKSAMVTKGPIRLEVTTSEAKAPVTGKLKAHTEYLTIKTTLRTEMVHITPQVKETVARSGVQDGLCYISPMHITAAIYLNDNKAGLNRELAKWLEEKAPRWPEFQQRNEGEENADAHVKAVMMHHETTLPVTGGRLDLGTWQRIFYAEFDGQRAKQIIVKVMGVAKE